MLRYTRLCMSCHFRHKSSNQSQKGVPRKENFRLYLPLTLVQDFLPYSYAFRECRTGENSICTEVVCKRTLTCSPKVPLSHHPDIVAEEHQEGKRNGLFGGL